MQWDQLIDKRMTGAYSHSWVNGTSGSMDQNTLVTAFLAKSLRTFCNIHCIVPMHVSAKVYRGTMSRCCRRLVSCNFWQKLKFDEWVQQDTDDIVADFLWLHTNYMLYNELQMVILKIAMQDCMVFTKVCRTSHDQCSESHHTCQIGNSG